MEKTINKVSETKGEIVEVIPEKIERKEYTINELKDRLNYLIARKQEVLNSEESATREIENATKNLEVIQAREVEFDAMIADVEKTIDDFKKAGIKEVQDTIAISAEPLPVDEPVLPV